MKRKHVTVWKEIEAEVEVDLSDFDDEDLIDELENRGFLTYRKGTPSSSVEYLYSVYMTTPQATFEKELKKFFRDSLGVNLY